MDVDAARPASPELYPTLFRQYIQHSTQAALEALRSAGRSVPEDVAVVGYDDISLAAYCSPPLTTVRQNTAAAGNLLVERLLAQIEGQPAPAVVLPVELVIRESCGALAL